jgi:branched-chain amino acid transport system permease protein
VGIFSAYTENLLIYIGINTILAYSFFIPLSTGQVSGGQSAFMAIGAYLSAMMTVKFHFPFAIALPLAGLASGVVGALVGFPALRLKGLYLVIMTLGFAEVVRVFFLNNTYFGAAYGFGGIQEETSVFNVYFVLALLIAFLFRLNRSYLGRAFEAIKENDMAAETLGVPLTRMKVFAFALGGVAAGLGGALYAHYALFIDSNNFGFGRSIEMVIFTIFGGAQTICGPLLGATVLTLLPEFLRVIQDWRLIFYGLIVVGLMTFRPEGVLTKGLFYRLRRKNEGAY